MGQFNNYPFWTARFWHGMRLLDWLRLAGRNGFRIHPSRWPMALTITSFSLFNSTASAAQSLLFSRRIRALELPEPPVFIIGHWRSGTTMLHELLVCDQRFAYPTTYQCFAPSHCLVTEWWASRLFWFLAPRQRPMDNMRAGMSLPQEDEFAMVALGAPSPYLRMAFPRHPPPFMEFLDMAEVEPQLLQRWREAMLRFAKVLTIHTGQRLVFKSPPHTGRIAELSRLFPGAKFIHISRHPHALFPSTVRLWQALDQSQGLQKSSEDGRNEYVLESFERMYRGFDAFRDQLPPEQLCEVRYETLVQDPLGVLQQVYQQLQLPDFSQARESVQQYFADRSDYQANQHPQLPPELQQQVAQRWGGYMDRYGYH